MLAFQHNVAPIYSQQTQIENLKMAKPPPSRESLRQRRVSFASIVIESNSQIGGQQSGGIQVFEYRLLILIALYHLTVSARLSFIL